MESLFKKYETRFRKVHTTEKILKSVKRVNVFQGADLYMIFKDLNMSKDEINEMVKYLLLNNIIFKVEIDKNNKKNCDVLLDYRFSEKDFFIWSEEKSSNLNLIICLGVILVGLCLVLFQMWPSNMKFLASYVSYLCAGFIIFLLVLGVIRLILFCVTYFTHSPGIWLFPNLFADCGFVDSFIPVWCYHGEDVNKKKNE
ncbi:hypothetical protein P3W45_001029 [Vairimorpha bombi]|jgi:translocation protein SEC62